MDTKQVIVMRKDLGMRKGKMVAQGAHASMAFLTRNYGRKLNKVQQEWMANSFAKICVYVNSEEELMAIDQLAYQHGIESHLIRDSGRTEFHGIPTLTCLALGPDYNDKIDKVTGDLPLL